MPRPPYLALLAESYDALKAVSEEVNVIGGSLSARGSDDPAAARQTHSPTTFIRDLGAAYRASGRTDRSWTCFRSIRIRRTRASHRTSSTRAARRSGSRTTTSSSRSSARHSTAPASRARRSRSSTASTACRRRSPPARAAVLGRRAGDDETDRRGVAGSRVRGGDQDGRVPADRPHAALLPRLGRAAARAPPDGRLLRGRHPEAEPGARRQRGPCRSARPHRVLDQRRNVLAEQLELGGPVFSAIGRGDAQEAGVCPPYPPGSGNANDISEHLAHANGSFPTKH